MNRTLKSILQDIDVLGIKGGYDIEQLLTPYDCRILKSEIERLNKKNKNLKEDYKRHIDRINELTNRIDKAIEFLENNGEEICYSYYQSRELLDKLLNILNGDYEV